MYEAVTLRPDSSDPRFQPIEIDLQDPDRPCIVAVFIAALA